MTFKEWRLWLKDLPWIFTWFVLIVLFRPVIDNFYYLKEIPPFLSPLYLVGVLTPLLCVVAISRVGKPKYSRLDTIMSFYSVLIALSCFFLLIGDSFSMDSIEFTLKLTLPAFLYFFCRRLIRSKRDLIGVFVTFLYSSIFVLALLLYELIFNPISTQMSRGLERIQGNFADVSNYAFYATCGVLLSGFFFFENSKSKNSTKRILAFLAVLAISLLISSNIHHTASYAVIVALFTLFIINNLKAHKGSAIFFIFTISILAYAVGKETIDENIRPLIETDIQVYEGEKDSEALFHGRVGRWQTFLDVFFESNIVSQFIGVPSSVQKPFKYISKGAHTDYLRILMFTGYLGLATYLIFLWSIFKRSLKRGTSVKFLGLGALAIIGLYSVSTTPSLYAPLLYVLVPVTCILALPETNSKENL